MADPQRPSPDALLREAAREGRGKLKIFLGAAPGVGKTYEMLSDGAAQARAGVDTVIGVVETHGRAETAALVAPLEIIPRRKIDYEGHSLDEMDIDAILARAPALALVDEFAHTNAAGSRHPKRWQDVEELLAAGIDVYTTLNIQHVESLNDIVASFTRVRVRETVPDAVFEEAEIEVVDLPPDELIERLKAGKVYVPAEASRALGHFFSKSNLSALREMALRRAAMSVDKQMLEHLDANALAGTYAAGERVLVAVSELPGSDSIVRAAKRLADALRAPWQAIFVETPRAAGFGAAQAKAVADSLRLAATLGASTATVPAESVIAGLATHLAQMRGTQLVIGKSRRSWWFSLRHGSVVDALLRRLDGVAVHVIPAGDTITTRAPIGPKLLTGWGRLRDYPIIAVMVAGVTGLGILLQPWMGTGAVDLLYLLPVIVAAERFGLRPGLVTGLLAALAYNFFFLPPIHTFTIADPQSVLTFAIFLGLAAFVSGLAGRLSNRASIGARSAHENAAIAAFGQALARTSDRGETAAVVCEEISRLLDVNVQLLGQRDGELLTLAACPSPVPLQPIDQAAADWAWSRAEMAGRGTATLNAADWQFHPLKTALGVLAVLGIARDDGAEPIGADRTVLLSTLVGQAALAHERLSLEGEMRELSILKERDRLRAALLSSIGHDLRTPLTAISSAADAIAADYPHAAPVPILRAETDKLRRFLDNLVDMIRIDSGALVIAPEPIDLTDAVGAAVHDLRDLLRASPIDLQVAANLPLVRADPRLLHHILINLLANAVQHGGDGPIAIRGRRTRDALLLEVADRGPGLAPGAERRVFETFVRGKGGDRHGGSGLGLAIVKGFAEAMGVRVSAANDPEGGAIFTLTFGGELLAQGDSPPFQGGEDPTNSRRSISPRSSDVPPGEAM